MNEQRADAFANSVSTLQFRIVNSDVCIPVPDEIDLPLECKTEAKLASFASMYASCMY